mgnify:CR=1 FL=1
MTDHPGWKPGERWLAFGAVAVALVAPVVAAVVAWYLNTQFPGQPLPSTSGSSSQVSSPSPPSASPGGEPITSTPTVSSTTATTQCLQTYVTVAPGVEVPLPC